VHAFIATAEKQVPHRRFAPIRNDKVFSYSDISSSLILFFFFQFISLFVRLFSSSLSHSSRLIHQHLSHSSCEFNDL